MLLCSWNFTANAVSVAIGDNGNRLIFEIWWNFFYDLFSIKHVADVNNIDSVVSKRNMEEFSVFIMKRFRSNWHEKTKGRHVTYNTRQSVLRRKRIYTSFKRPCKSNRPNLKKELTFWTTLIIVLLKEQSTVYIHGKLLRPSQ